MEHSIGEPERKVVYQGKAFDVARHKLVVDGRKITRDLVERDHGVVVVPIDRNFNVVMLSEFCAGSASFILSLPGGSIEDSEEPETAARRELREETGLDCTRLAKLRFAYSHPSTSTRKSYVYIGYDLFESTKDSSDEIIDLVTIPLDDAIVRSYRDFESDVSTMGNLLMARDWLRKERLVE